MEKFLNYYNISQTASSFPPINKVMKFNIGNLNEINFSIMYLISCFWKALLILIFEPYISGKEKIFI